MKRLSTALLAVVVSQACGGAADSADSTPQMAAYDVPVCIEGADPAALAERPSPLDSVLISLGGHEAKLCYGRPSARGRTMVGGQDPFGSPWRMGANEPTRLFLPVAASVGGLDLDAGAYALYAIPTESDWTIVVNGAVERWGVPITPEVRASDVGEFTVTPSMLSEPVETLMFSYEDGSLVYAWEGRTFRIPVSTG